MQNDEAIIKIYNIKKYKLKQLIRYQNDLPNTIKLYIIYILNKLRVIAILIYSIKVQNCEFKFTKKEQWV